MNIVSALLRVVGKHTAARKDDAWWWSINYATGDRRIYRHRETRFVYPPSFKHVHFGTMRTQSDEHIESAHRSAPSVHDKVEFR